MRSMVEGGVHIRSRCVAGRTPFTMLCMVPLPIKWGGA